MSPDPAVESPIRAAIRGATLPRGFRIRVASEDDLPALGALREAVGWRVHAWALRDILATRRARLFVAESGGRVVGSGSGIAYGALGVVGNMVTAPDQRRRGIGRAILDRVLEFLDERGVRQAELYATAEGKHLYAAAGFADAGTNLSVRIPRHPARTDGVDLVRATSVDLAELAAYDAPRFAGDRSELLAAAIADEQRAVLVAREGSEVTGFAMLQPEAGRIGPWLADGRDVARALLGEAFERSPGESSLTAAMPIENEAGAKWMRQLGAEMHRWDGRMRLGSGVRQDHSRILSIMVGALG
jgi:GNAT superfamily N-acetyltransferase